MLSPIERNTEGFVLAMVIMDTSEVLHGLRWDCAQEENHAAGNLVPQCRRMHTQMLVEERNGAACGGDPSHRTQPESQGPKELPSS